MHLSQVRRAARNLDPGPRFRVPHRPRERSTHTEHTHYLPADVSLSSLSPRAYSLYPSPPSDVEPPPDVPPAIHAGPNCDGGDAVHRHGADTDALLSIAAAVRRHHAPQRPGQATSTQVSLPRELELSDIVMLPNTTGRAARGAPVRGTRGPIVLVQEAASHG